MGYFCKAARVEVFYYAYHNWYNMCLSLFFVLFYIGLFEWFIHVVYIIYDIQSVVVSRVLKLYEF
jgi:hypothetical protein